MVLKGTYGPDRVLYGLMGFLQSTLPAKVAAYSSSEKASLLFTIPGENITISDDTGFDFKYQTSGTSYTINFPKGTYTLSDIKNTINSASQSLQAVELSQFSLLFTTPGSMTIQTAFGNLREGQVVNYQPLKIPSYYQISGVLPSEAELKCYPAVLLTLDSVNVDNAGIVQKYNVSLALALTSPIATSQSEYLSREIFKYYDIIFDLLYRTDDGSLGGICNGVRITSARVGEATGRNNYLKILNISLSISVEED